MRKTAVISLGSNRKPTNLAELVKPRKIYLKLQNTFKLTDILKYPLINTNKYRLDFRYDSTV